MTHRLAHEFWIVARAKKHIWQGFNARLCKKRPRLQLGEIGIRLTLDIPAALFAQPVLEAKMRVPDDAAGREQLKRDIAQLTEIVSSHTSMDVKFELIGVGK